MLSYTPPLKDMRFVLERVLRAPEALAAMPAYAEVDADLMRQVCEEAGRFAAGVLFPLNAPGDREGCRYEQGAVATPRGYADAYRQFVDAGWPALACAPEHGGQGLPQVLNCVLNEVTSAANHGWGMYPGLAHGAYACLARYGSAELRERYLPKIVSGEWLATMCLTEAQAGSDLGLLRSRAAPVGGAADGAYAVSGSKIFISGGEQDMSANIVHLVLARLPDAPPGSKGVSLLLVPKWLPDGARNAVHCTGIEHKMGIRGSATCGMEFEGATGWLVGEPHRGLAAMFVMMNAARLQVGAQGLGIAETAWQNAQAYALERVQSKAAGRPESRRGEAADPIAMHAPVQRLLMTQRAWVEGGRMLAYWTALAIDGAEQHPDPAVREELHGQVGLITPVVKAMLTAQGYEAASQALQVFGGHGYIAETGIEQYVRDARVTMIYEGTNEIQAVDLLLRKVLADGGARLEGLLAQAMRTALAEGAHDGTHNRGQDRQGEGAPGSALAPHARAVRALVLRMRATVRAIAQASQARAELPHRVAPEMLRLVGHCALAWMWLRAARAAIDGREEDPAFHDAKRATASYYFTYVLPEVEQLFGVVDGCLSQAPADAPCFSV